MLPLGQPTCLTIPLEGRSPFQMNVAGKAGGNVTGKVQNNAGRVLLECYGKVWGQCGRNAALQKRLDFFVYESTRLCNLLH